SNKASRKDGVDSKKTGSKLSGLADKIKNIDGKISGKDGRPLKAHRVVNIACGVVETMANSAETMPINVGTNNPSDNNPFVPTVPLNEKEDVIDIIGADVVIPYEEVDRISARFENSLYEVDRISARFENSLYGYFIGRHEKYVENGPWRIRYVPLILNIWNPKSELNKEDIKKVPMWIKMFNVPTVAYSEGLCSYARALVEISADNKLLESLVVAIPLEKGMGNRMVSIGIEFEWKPPRCASCKNFDHVDKECRKKWEEVIRKQSIEAGFVHVKQKTKGAKLKWFEEDKVLDINTEFGSDSVFETQDSMLTSSKSMIGDGKIQEKGSLWERFKEAKEASTSKPRSHMSDIEDESDEDEVYMPDDYKLNIFPRMVESLLWRTMAR
nr:hypothetical protein [Tanacetum cinerariifolium]